MIRIGIDCRKISDGGIGTYIKNLIRCWKVQNPDAEFYLFCLSADTDVISDFKGHFKIIIHDYPKYSLSELFSFRKPLIEQKIDVFFCPHYTLPLNLRCPSVVTIYDLIHLRMPVKGGPFGRLYARYIIKHACKNSSAILTISEFSKNDIIDLFPAYSSKVKSIYIGVDRSIFKPLPEAMVSIFRKRKALDRRFALYVGALKNHKNPDALISAVNEINIPLVILSNDTAIYNDKILPGIHDKSLVRLIECDNEDEIALLYNSATLLFHPALYEGFGLPPLEAMACGLPVVCSAKTSLPEVVGDAAITFSPENCNEMSSALNSVWNDDELRARLSAKGLERAKKFDWEDTAKKTFEILRDAVG